MEIPKLILHDWDFDMDVVERMKELGYYDGHLLGIDEWDKEEQKDATVLVTYLIDWCEWDYKLKRGESEDPAILNWSEEEVEDYKDTYLKGYFDCGADKELFLQKAKFI